MSKRPHPDPEIQAWCQTKFDEIDAIRTELDALFERRSKKSYVKRNPDPATRRQSESATKKNPSQRSSTTRVKKMVTVPVSLKDTKAKAKSAEPVKKPKEALKVKAPANTSHHLPNIHAHRNRAQFWQAWNEKAVEEYRLLTDAEKLARADRLKAAYEEEVLALEAQNPESTY